MEFEKAMREASAYLVFDPMFIDPAEPQGLWIFDTPEEVALAKVNAVCLSLMADADDIVKCREFIRAIITAKRIPLRALIPTMPK